MSRETAEEGMGGRARICPIGPIGLMRPMRIGRMRRIAASGRNQRGKKRGARHATVRRIDRSGSRGGFPLAGSGRGALVAPGRVWPMRLWAGGGCPGIAAGKPADRKGAGKAALALGVAGGCAVPCAPLRRLAGAMVRPDGRGGPQEPAAARRQEAAVRLEPLWNEQDAGLRTPQGDRRGRAGGTAWGPGAVERRQRVAGGVSRRDHGRPPPPAPKAAEEWTKWTAWT